jgi:hypothetical protein
LFCISSDPQAKLYRKAAGHEAKLCYMGHAVMETDDHCTAK